MAHAAEPINTNLQMNGKPVLVQNPLGIFYGILEKSDTRNGTALLRDSFMISPDRHITFAQYVNFLYGTLETAYFDSMDKLVEGEEYSQLDIEPINEIVVNYKTFSEHKRNLSLSDYASEGIALVQSRASAYWNVRQAQSVTPLVSLTNVLAISSISNRSAAVHAELDRLYEDMDDQTGDSNFIRQLLPENGLILDFFKYTVLRTFEDLANNNEPSPRLVVTTPEREAFFSKTGL